MSRGKVVILEPLSNSLDTSSLLELGEVSVIFGSNNGLTQTPSVFRTEEYITAIHRWLKRDGNFDPDKDSFVLTGRLTKLAVAVAAIIRFFPDRDVNFLVFDGGSGRYIKRSL